MRVRFVARPAPWCLRAAILLAVALRPAVGEGGSGVFKKGVFDFCVSVRFEATDAQLETIKRRFQGGSNVLNDATDGQHRFGKVWIVNKSKAGSAAEYFVHQQNARASTPVGATFGKRGCHSDVYFGDNFGQAIENYTIAHEFGHLAYGLSDEYRTRGGDAALCVPDPEEPETLTACLMDDYYERGGGRAAPTLNEYCVRSNHDPNHDTWQHQDHGKSCFETASTSRFPVKLPADLPTAAAPKQVDLEFPVPSSVRRFVIVLDRSAAMAGDKLKFAKRAVAQLVKTLKTGYRAAVVDFNDTANTRLEFTRIGGADDKTTLMNAINGITAQGDTAAIGDALTHALGLITALDDFSCQTIIILLSNGASSAGADPLTVVPSLREKLVSVVSLGLGAATDMPLMEKIASTTGGKFYRIERPGDLPDALDDEMYDSGILARKPSGLAQGGREEQPVEVDTTTGRAAFILNWPDPADVLHLSLRRPDDSVITASDAGANGIEFSGDEHSELFVIESPPSGAWTMIIDAESADAAGAEFVGAALSDSVQIALTVSVDATQLRPSEPVRLRATAIADVPVFGATVTATVERPDDSLAAVTLYDDGDDVLHGDDLAGDGAYSALFAAYTTDGVYTFDVLAVHPGGSGRAPGESLFDAPPDLSPVPAFQRQTRFSVIVRSDSFCGDGTVDLGEDCDPGTAFDDCCSFTCEFAPAGTPCMDDGTTCSTDECDSSGTCAHTVAAPFPDGTGCLTLDGAKSKCEQKVAKNLGSLLTALLVCHRKQAQALFAGPSFDDEACEAAAVQKFLAKTDVAGCPCVNQDALATEAEAAVDAANALVYCEGWDDATSTCSPTTAIDPGGDATGCVPSSKTILTCQKKVLGALAKLEKAWLKCRAKYAKSYQATGGTPTFDEEQCESTALTKFRSIDTSSCAPCNAANASALEAEVAAQLDAGNGVVYCEP